MEEKVLEVLGRYANTGKRVRIFYGHKNGLDWLEENHVTGRVSSSMGPMKIFIMLSTKHSSGGPGILTGSIVKIIAEGGYGVTGVVYQHPNYHLPEIKYGLSWSPSLPVAIYVDGKEHAAFKTQKAAERWLAFILGRRMTK